MSKHDYTKFAKPVESDETLIKPDETTVEPEPKTVLGVVVDCDLLRVRKRPSTEADVLCVIERGSEVTVDDPDHVGKFYKVCTATGVEGYCAKPYIEIKG